MKLALVSSGSAPFSPVRGGVIGTQHELFTRLPEIDVTVFAPPDPVEFAGLRIRHIRTRWMHRLQRATRRLPAQLRVTPSRLYPYVAAVKVLRGRFDIIYVTNRPSWPVIFRRLHPRTALVLLMWNDHMLSLTDDELRRCVDACDGIIFISAYLQQGVLDRLPSAAAKSHVLALGIDASTFSSENGYVAVADPDRPIVLFAGRLIPEKGLHLLLDAFAIVREQVPAATLHIAGAAWFGPGADTPYMASVRASAERHGDAVQFLGAVSHEDMPAVFQRATVFVCPSTWNEPHGAVNVEAMAAGVPLVTADRGGIPECARGVAILVDPENVDQLAGAIVRVLESETLRSDMIDKGAARVRESYDWTAVAPRYLRLLRSMSARIAPDGDHRMPLRLPSVPR